MPSQETLNYIDEQIDLVKNNKNKWLENIKKAVKGDIDELESKESLTTWEEYRLYFLKAILNDYQSSNYLERDQREIIDYRKDMLDRARDLLEADME